MEISKNIERWKQELPHNLKSGIYSVAWKVFHVLFSWGDTSLENTSKKYLQKAHINLVISEESLNAIGQFKQWWRGIIMSSHPTWYFSDYLPLFATLGDQILKKAIFYTGAYNLSMNKREFPEYTFRAATLIVKEDAMNLKQQLAIDIEKINSDDGYIFIIPSWETVGEDVPFKGISRRIIQWSQDNLPVLVNHIHHKSPISRKDIARFMLTGKWETTTISSQLTTIQDRKEWGKVLTGKEMREKYKQLDPYNK